MTTIFQLLNNKVEIFFSPPSPPPSPTPPPRGRVSEPGHFLGSKKGKKKENPQAPVLPRGDKRPEERYRAVTQAVLGGKQEPQSYILRAKLWILAQQP